MRRIILPTCAGTLAVAIVSIAAAQMATDPNYPADKSLRGQSMADLTQLPDFLGAQWNPQIQGKSEGDILEALARPPVKADYRETMAQAMNGLKDGTVKSMAADCRLEGMPRLAWYPYPLQFLFGPGAVMIRANGFVRGIQTNGLEHPPELFDSEALQAFAIIGDQRAVWDGDVLVVDTVKSREDRELFYGVPFDPDMHVQERYRLLDKNRMERVTTITAPNILTSPWVTRIEYHRGSDASFANFNCMLPGEPVT